MPFTTTRDNKEIFWQKSPFGLVTALVATACCLGWMIASEKWLFVAAAFSLPLLLMRRLK